MAVPLGSDYLPADQIGEVRDLSSMGTGSTPYSEEALRWLPEGMPDGGRPRFESWDQAAISPAGHPGTDRIEGDDRPRVLVADDNADMRQYVAHLLGDRHRVEAVPDGEAALAAARDRPPDLILTDVMMPRLDGFE